MSPEDARIREARTEVEAARRLLLSPVAAALDRSVPHLERAAGHLKALLDANGGPRKGRPAQAGLRGLAQAISRVAALLENSSSFYIGWSRQLAAAACGYTRSGEPATSGGRPTLSVEG